MNSYMAALKKRLRGAYSRLRDSGGWRAVGAEFGISGGLAYRIVKEGYEPQDAHIRHALGLPALAPTPVCPVCGVVHVAKVCPLVRKSKRKWNGWLDYPANELKQLFKERIEL